MPRSFTPAAMMAVRASVHPSASPSVRPSTVEAAIAEVEIAALRAPALEAVTLELAARTAELRDVTENAAEAVREARRQALESSEESLVLLATAIARRIVGRELSTDPSLVRAWVREGIASLGSEDRVEVRVAPDLAEHIGTIDCEIAGRIETDLVVDPTLEETQITIVGRYGHVDASFEARFSAVKAALGAGAEK
jgi:flagellar assembly protein FliH